MLDESELYKIKDAKDSKLLTKYRRQELYKKYIKKVKYKMIKIEPREIDECVNSDNTNLNWLEAEKSAEIINELKPSKAYIDCPSPNIIRYKDYLRNLLENKDVELIIGHHMESKNKLVALASIIAKVVRDKEIEEIQKKYGKFGTGYSHDPETRKFLEKNWNKHPGIFRKSWSTWKDYDNKKKQATFDKFY